MVRPKTPARYRTDATSASVQRGDIVIIYGDSGYSISGVNTQVVTERNGYDGGWIGTLIVLESGTISISLPSNATSDIIHTGRQDLGDLTVDGPISEQQNLYGNWVQLEKGDVFVDWDEDDHGTGSYWNYTGQYVELFDKNTDVGHSGYDGGEINRNVIQVKEAGTLSVTSEGNRVGERDALKFTEYKYEQNPTNLAANAVSSTEIDVSWDAPSDPYYFLLERKRSGAKYNKEFNVDGTQRSYTDNDVSTGTEYIYRTKSATPTTPEFDIGVDTAQVDVGDLVFMYENGSLSGVSHSAVANMIGYDGGRFKAFKINEKGQVTINASYGGDVIYASRPDTTSIDVRAKLWGQQDGTGTIITGLDEGDYVIQWDEDSHGIYEGGYHSYSGKYELLYLEWDGNVGRRVYAVKTGGDLTRDQDGYVETVGLDTTLSPTDGLPIEFTSPSNEDSAEPIYPDISVR